MKTSNKSRFAVCIKNRGDEASLEVGKLYRVVSDQDAQRHGYRRRGAKASREGSPQGRFVTIGRRTSRSSGRASRAADRGRCEPEDPSIGQRLPS